MTSFSYKDIFRRAGVAITVAAAGTIGCESIGPPVEELPLPKIDIYTLTKDGPVCAAMDTVEYPRTAAEYYLAARYRNLSDTRIGMMLLGHKAKNTLKVCYDRALDAQNACGIYHVAFVLENNISLNPAGRVSDIARDLTLIHEPRHIFQDSIGLNHGIGKNIPEYQRVVLYWMREADARVASIIYAHEKLLQGNSAYKDSLARDSGHKEMVAAFYDSLEKEPGNLNAASRAAMLAFLKNGHFKMDYASQVVDFVNTMHKTYDPKKPAGVLFTDEMVMKMGYIGGYGNYMRQSVIDQFRAAFTAKDYAALVAARTVKGGQPACAL